LLNAEKHRENDTLFQQDIFAARCHPLLAGVGPDMGQAWGQTGPTETRIIEAKNHSDLLWFGNFVMQ